ncbi:MAG: 30S ribosomal protein S4 [Candidatus Yanofskybacteria bacterium GW2011_GWA1_48_10]|uniref:Small ribosomal subunit protein uS4 n=2 Tax=Candidatus Yanofskyibacteriota TaxID=1752733 RepID=A0A0G1U7W3_9BACT|nr:MAG: 30S ribosomal protein S4 [Candidatus Yanofskybacteria bacterium GW2011_GWA1_48_10]OGN06611.1 MAG: 30S ribosomal protein S4 [Candidatus Yanofskybacteria bacterium RIFCSPHIGHO2_01_FULL_48_25b]
MARYTGPKEKIERRIGERIGIKGLRSQMGKTAITKKPYPPGINGQKPSRKLSEFGSQLKTKQKIRNTYRLLEKQFKSYIKASVQSKKDPYSTIVNALEHRLDNVVYRMGLAQSRDQARQLVNHGHILVNNKKVSIPSCAVKIGDVISVREGSKKSNYFMNLVPQWIQKHDPPSWISLDKDAGVATVKGMVSPDESGINPGDLRVIIEYYSR